jgi:N-acetylmuramoyl-L-alanine amidase
MTRIYLSPSNQEHNQGVGKYGTEEARMHELAGRVATLLRAHGFQTKISQPQWSMGQVVSDSNSFKADAHVCIHTNAGGGNGTVGFYGSPAGKALLTPVYARVAKASPGPDEGMKSWAGLYEIGNTAAPCAYLELFFHDNYAEVADYLAHSEKYAEAIARGICDRFKVPWEKATPTVDYRALKREAVKVANTLGIPHENITVTVAGKGAAFEALLRAIAEHKD